MRKIIRFLETVEKRAELGGVRLDTQKKLMCLLMTVLVFVWGMDYIAAKQALTSLAPLTLLFFKYMIASVIVVSIKLKLEGGHFFRRQDLPLFILCGVFGELGYYYFEYTSMSYLPVSLVTIVLAFVPVVSILIDRVLYHKKTSKKVAIGILCTILGVALIIGVDYKILLQGRIIGYLLAFGAVGSWNVYNFVTASLHERYGTVTLTFNQLICTIILAMPYALRHLPDVNTITPAVIGGVLYLGIISAGLGIIVQVRALHVLGPTTAALFSNFLPVSATILGWLILKETITMTQMIGGVIVITAGFVVIREKGKVEELSND